MIGKDIRGGRSGRLRQPAHCVIGPCLQRARLIRHRRQPVHGIVFPRQNIARRIHDVRRIAVGIVAPRGFAVEFVRHAFEPAGDVVGVPPHAAGGVGDGRQAEQLVVAVGFRDAVAIRRGQQQARVGIGARYAAPAGAEALDGAAAVVAHRGPDRTGAVGARRHVALRVVGELLRRAVRILHPHDLLERERHRMVRGRIGERLFDGFPDNGRGFAERVGRAGQPPSGGVESKAGDVALAVRGGLDMAGNVAGELHGLSRAVRDLAGRQVVVIVVDESVGRAVGIGHIADKAPHLPGHGQAHAMPERIGLGNAARVAVNRSSRRGPGSLPGGNTTCPLPVAPGTSSPARAPDRKNKTSCLFS